MIAPAAVLIEAPRTERRESLRVRLPRWAAPLLLGVLCLVVYNANLRTIGAGDTLPARYQPLILWHDGTFALDGNVALVAHGHPLYPLKASGGASSPNRLFGPGAYWMIHTRRGQTASLYPVLAPLLVAPLYLPAALWLNSTGWQQPHVDRVAEIMEKISASLLASIASVLMFLVLRRERNPWALPLALAFAFGTDTWMISSQALWQHGSGEVLITLALLLSVARATPLRTGSLGCVCVLIAANRPPDALIAGAFLAHAVWTRRREAVWLLAGAAVPLAGLLYYNLHFIGNLVGGYALARGQGKHFFHLNLLGPPGLLISPTRGLLVFCPFLVFLPLGLVRRLRTPSSKRLAIALTAALFAQFIVYAAGDWRAGESWGPRWLTDLLPIMVWMLAPVPLLLAPRARRVFAVLIVVAIGIQTIGAFWYTHASDARIFANASMTAAWAPGNTPFLVELTHRPAPFELPCSTSGSIDRPPPLLTGTGPVPRLNAGAAIQGWALACGHPPAQVILLIDGHVLGETTRFVRRPDVDRALHVTAASGWSVPADTTGVTPGRHLLQLAVRIATRSDVRILRQEPVLVSPPPSLEALATRAAGRIAHDQAQPGYWLTDFTSRPRYLGPREEMNTYLTSILVDLLSPIAPRFGLRDALARARRELKAQIEPTGLVRYHGLPSGPTIGTLGCVITPDADDTALAWRIAGRGPADPRWPSMRRTLARYRDAQGLYRTWLAPRSRYQCLDPGRDPDPADIGIQMHVYLMLHEFDRPAAGALCTAMQRSVGHSAVWVYYAVAPLVPYLRAAELQQLGCPLPLPSARLSHPTPGQEWWSGVAGLLVQAGAPHPTAQSRRATRDLLTQLAAGDFALLRQAPPLVFHNDLSASVPRFYWSRDAGYALWLRLYATMRSRA